MEIQGKRIRGNLLYDKSYFIWHNMLDRCYNKNNHAYKNYGNKGVTVCDEWKTYDGFINDIDRIIGFDIDLLLNGKLCLDKDKLFVGNKIYSLETCCFISVEENNRYKPNQQKNIIAISPNGDIYEFYDQSEFAKEHNLCQSKISECVNNKIKSHKKWLFKLK